MSVTIIKQGLLDTIQDEGRFGFQHLGVNAGGSMDFVAARIANMLVGNIASEAVIELHFPAASFMFQKNCLIAVTGADFSPVVNDEPLPVNTPIIVPDTSVLRFTKYANGCRCYLAVHGGWDADRWLNSYSTNIKVAAGGYKGRALRKDDVIRIKEPEFRFLRTNATQNPKAVIVPVKADVPVLYGQTKKIRCITGSQYEWLSNDSKNTFQSSSFKITTQSDRMGYRLQGRILEAHSDHQLLSAAVTSGTIQLLPSGQMIILMADHQTTGGYPVIAHVISADLPRLAQLKPNEDLNFELITHAEAEEAFMQQYQHLQQTEVSIKLQLEQFFIK